MRNVLKLSYLLVMAALSLTAADPFLGSWKLDAGKSRSNLKNPPPPFKSLVVTYTRQGEDLKVTSDLTLPDGKTRTVEHVWRYDGKDYPRYPGAAPGDTVTTTRIDKFTEESAFKKDGNVTITTRRVVSPDGQTMTATAKSKAADGSVVETVTVYEKLSSPPAVTP
jgi:hypothetical protein